MRYRESDRYRPDWWHAPVQSRDVQDAARQLCWLSPEYLFLHGPPIDLAAETLGGLVALAKSIGSQLGICGGKASLFGRPEFAVVQVHLDALMRLTEKIPANRPLWVHGIYSPGVDSRWHDVVSRERFCVDLARSNPSVSLVVSTKTVGGLRRAEALAEACR